ncbi:MAG: hypothetical protein GY768_05815 [Planctomycetaceae bacterium]|nr:hypothetical protein [Planctomycetaceae bacterium]
MHLDSVKVIGESQQIQQKLDKLSDDFQPIADWIGESADGLLTSLAYRGGRNQGPF